MNAENRGIIKAYNSNFTNNFAFGSGVIKAVNDGSYELFSWNLTDNYAYYAPVSEIFSTTTFSKINNCRISRNIVLSKEDILGSFLKQSKYSFINFLVWGNFNLLNSLEILLNAKNKTAGERAKEIKY